VIWGNDAGNFILNKEILKNGLKALKDKKVSISGVVELYSRKPQIVAREPDQLSLVEE
jgi:hypothetical protein